MTTQSLYPVMYQDLVRAALQEDLGRAGDLSTDHVVPADLAAQGDIIARQAGRIAGLEVALNAFRELDPSLEIVMERRDGEAVAAGMRLARISGSARAILSGERTALNILGRLCGIATATAEAVEAVGSHKARIVCTRKTTPGLRLLEKYAVRMGGGANHRFGLDDAVLLKDNHLVAAGGLTPALERLRGSLGHMVKIEVEVDTLEQLEELLSLEADAVLLDNMNPDQLRQAVVMVDGRMITEASGGITPETVAEVAASGVDMISLGWLTHSVRNMDVALDMVLD